VEKKRSGCFEGGKIESKRKTSGVFAKGVTDWRTKGNRRSEEQCPRTQEVTSTPGSGLRSVGDEGGCLIDLKKEG